jgi:hypothetical protein
MPIHIFIDTRPTGFILVNGRGEMFLKGEASLTSPGVGGEELSILAVLNIPPNDSLLMEGWQWEVRREGEESYVIEMVGDGTIEWNIPLQMSVSRSDLVQVARTLGFKVTESRS